MPHHKSAKKRLKTNERDRERNMAVKSALRKQLKAFRLEGASADKLGELYAGLDRAARKGVIPKSRADRLKSRLAAAVNRAS